MTTDSSPWDVITVPKEDFNVRQVAIGTSAPCFWGRDAYGAYLFIVDLEGDHKAQYLKNTVIVKGVDVDLREVENGHQRLILILEQHVDRDLFEALCHSLAIALKQATDSASSLAISMAHLHRWKSFLSGRSQRLTDEAVRGLFAEVSFLLELLDRKIPRDTAVGAWLGPERSHQDFIFSNTAVEIKSLIGTERSSIRISSEDQLESLNDALYLRIYKLSKLAGVAGARSLNELISEVHKRLMGSSVIEPFNRKLTAIGYAPLLDYDEPRFVVNDVISYRIDKSFPRLVRSQLPTGIANVTYDIKLESITQFEVEEATIFKGL